MRLVDRRHPTWIRLSSDEEMVHIGSLHHESDDGMPAVDDDPTQGAELGRGSCRGCLRQQGGVAVRPASRLDLDPHLRLTGSGAQIDPMASQGHLTMKLVDGTELGKVVGLEPSGEKIGSGGGFETDPTPVPCSRRRVAGDSLRIVGAAKHEAPTRLRQVSEPAGVRQMGPHPTPIVQVDHDDEPVRSFDERCDDEGRPILVGLGHTASTNRAMPWLSV